MIITIPLYHKIIFLVLTLAIIALRQFSNLALLSVSTISHIPSQQDIYRFPPSSFTEDEPRSQTSNQSTKQSTKQQQEQPNPKYYNIHDLEFVHIPKTGGSAIEEMAKRHGIPWGQCAFLPKGHAKCPGRRIPYGIFRARDVPFSGVPIWHVPPKYFDQVMVFRNDTRIGNPYIKKNNRTLFAVVRNPYDRLLSEYYFRMHLVLKKPLEYTNKAKNLNQFVMHHLSRMSKFTPNDARFYQLSGHLIPQYEYVYSDHNPSTMNNTESNIHNPRPPQEKLVHHVLSFENLVADFENLMTVYGQNKTDWIFPEPNTIRATSQKLLSPKDFSPESIQLIQTFYRKDFEMFHYDIDTFKTPKRIN